MTDTTTLDYDRELLLATLRRHDDTLPVAVGSALSAAADELTDPLVLPALVDVDDADTADTAAVIAAVRARLIAGIPASPTVPAAMASARAARHLHQALQMLEARSS